MFYFLAWVHYLYINYSFLWSLGVTFDLVMKLRHVTKWVLIHAKTCHWAYVDSQGPDQPAHLCSLIRSFTVCKQNHVQDDVNPHMLHKLKGRFSLDMAHTIQYEKKDLIQYEKKNLIFFSYFSTKTWVVGIHKKCRTYVLM